MAYRDQPVDPRILELEVLSATEPALRAELVPLRRELDELSARADVLGPQRQKAEADLEKRRKGGVIASLSGWFGKSIEEHAAEVARLVAEHDALLAQVAALTAQERELWQRILKAVDARAELARIGERAIEALRTAEGPDGDEMRLLDAEDARDIEQRRQIARVNDLVDLARTTVWQLQVIAADLARVTGTGSSVKAAFERMDSPLSVPEVLQDRQRFRERLALAIDHAASYLRELIVRYDDSGCEWGAQMSRARVLELAASPHADPVESSACVWHADALVECMVELARTLAEVRDRLARHVESRDVRRRELAQLAR